MYTAFNHDYLNTKFSVGEPFSDNVISGHISVNSSKIFLSVNKECLEAGYTGVIMTPTGDNFYPVGNADFDRFLNVELTYNDELTLGNYAIWLSRHGELSSELLCLTGSISSKP